MRASNAEIEARWVDAWNDLYQIVGETKEENWNAPCLLPNGRIVNVDECQGWLQDSAYERYLLRVEPGWILGRRGAVVSRTREGEDET